MGWYVKGSNNQLEKRLLSKLKIVKNWTAILRTIAVLFLYPKKDKSEVHITENTSSL